jgi:hypothetical protein
MDAPRIPDEFEVFEEIYNYRRSIQHIEREYLDLRIRLRDAEADLRLDSQNQDLKAQVDYFKSRLNDFESLYPWVSTGRPSEIAFCITPSGGI